MEAVVMGDSRNKCSFPTSVRRGNNIFYGRSASANIVFDYCVSDRPFTDMVVKPIGERFDGLPRLCRQAKRFLSPADELLDTASFAVIQIHDDVGLDHLLRLTPP